MPYIKDSERDLYLLEQSASYNTPGTPGQLNFQLTCLLKNYIEYNGLNYQDINDVIGALEGAKMEFYRRVAVPYEDSKIKENGDVY
jgi:hypothetical protein